MAARKKNPVKAPARKKTVAKARTGVTKRAAATPRKKTAPKSRVAAKAPLSASTKAAATPINDMEKTMTQGKAQFDKLTQDAAKNGKDQFDVLMKCGNVLMKGVEDMVKASVTLAQASGEKNAQAVKSILRCRTINEFADTHSQWVQQNFDDFMSGATRLSEMGIKVTTDAFEPINDHLGKAIRKATESMAA